MIKLLFVYQKGLSCPFLLCKFCFIFNTHNIRLFFLSYYFFNFVLDYLYVRFFYVDIFMGKFKSFFFDYEKIKSGYTKEDYSNFFNAIKLSSNKNSYALKGENHSSKQVVVKLISNLNAKQTLRCLDYVIKENDLDVVLKNELGEIVNKNNVLKDWALSDNEKNKECWHLMFSIKEAKTKENFEKLESAVLETMRENFPNHSFVFALHNHQNNPHIHIVLKKKNNLTKKKIHFEKKSDIKHFFSKLRDDFSMALNYKSLDYVSSKKIDRLDILLDEYQKREKKNTLSVEHYSRILLSQVDQYNKTKENIMQKISALKENQSSIRDYLKKHNEKPNKEFFEKIKEVKMINKKMSSLYRILSNHNRQKQKIKDEFLRFESRIKPLLGDNLNSIDTLKHLDKKIGKSKLSKDKMIKLQDIREAIQKNTQILDDFYSPMCEIFKKNLTINKLSAMLKEQRSAKNEKIENILIKEIEDRVGFYEKKLDTLGRIEALEGQKRVRAVFMLKEVEKGREILGLHSKNDTSSAPNTILHTKNQGLGGGIVR